MSDGGNGKVLVLNLSQVVGVVILCVVSPFIFTPPPTLLLLISQVEQKTCPLHSGVLPSTKNTTFFGDVKTLLSRRIGFFSVIIYTVCCVLGASLLHFPYITILWSVVDPYFIRSTLFPTSGSLTVCCIPSRFKSRGHQPFGLCYF